MSYSKTPIDPHACAAVEQLWLSSRQDDVRTMGEGDRSPTVMAYATAILARGNVERAREFPLNLQDPKELAWLAANPAAKVLTTENNHQPGTRVCCMKDSQSVWVSVPPKAPFAQLPPSGQAMFLAMGKTCVALVTQAQEQGLTAPISEGRYVADFDAVYHSRLAELSEWANKTVAAARAPKWQQFMEV